MATEKMGKGRKLGGSGVILLELALQISGYQSALTATLLTVIAFFLFLPMINEGRKRLWITGKRFLEEYRKSPQIRSMIFVILIGAGIGSVIGGALAGLGWWIVKNPRSMETPTGIGVLMTENGGVLTAPAASGPTATRPRRHTNTFTPQEIRAQLEQAGPLERDEVAEQFRYGIAEWTLLFDGDLVRHRGTDLMTVRFLPVNSPWPKVNCPEIKLEGNAYLGRIKSATRFRVKGVIGDVGLNAITLHEASFEQLPDEATPASSPSVSSQNFSKKVDPEWSTYTEPRFKRIKDCVHDAAQLLRDDGKTPARELWPFNAICRSGADQLQDNSEVIEVCEALPARGGWDHPFKGLENHVPQDEWLDFIIAATHRNVCVEMSGDYLRLAEQWPRERGRPDPATPIPRELTLLARTLRDQQIGREEGPKVVPPRHVSMNEGRLVVVYERDSVDCMFPTTFRNPRGRIDGIIARLRLSCGTEPDIVNCQASIAAIEKDGKSLLPEFNFPLRFYPAHEPGSNAKTIKFRRPEHLEVLWLYGGEAEVMIDLPDAFSDCKPLDKRSAYVLRLALVADNISTKIVRLDVWRENDWQLRITRLS